MVGAKTKVHSNFCSVYFPSCKLNLLFCANISEWSRAPDCERIWQWSYLAGVKCVQVISGSYSWSNKGWKATFILTLTVGNVPSSQKTSASNKEEQPPPTPLRVPTLTSLSIRDIVLINANMQPSGSDRSPRLREKAEEIWHNNRRRAGSTAADRLHPLHENTSAACFPLCRHKMDSIRL